MLLPQNIIVLKDKNYYKMLNFDSIESEHKALVEKIKNC